MPDPVLDAGVGAVSGFEERQLPDPSVGDPTGPGSATGVGFLEQGQLGAGVGSFAADEDPHPGRPAGQVEQVGDLGDVTAVTGPSTCLWWRSTSMSAIASPPSASRTARSTSTRPRSWTGWNERRFSALDRLIGQTDPVRQQPHRDRPGVRHHPGPVGRDRQPGRPRHMLHLRSALRLSVLSPREVQYLVARQALSRIQDPCQITSP